MLLPFLIRVRQCKPTSLPKRYRDGLLKAYAVQTDETVQHGHTSFVICISIAVRIPFVKGFVKDFAAIAVRRSVSTGSVHAPAAARGRDDRRVPNEYFLYTALYCLGMAALYALLRRLRRQAG